MQHGIKNKRLERNEGHRSSMLANLSASLIEHEQIITTVTKAKALKPFIEKVITLGKKGDLSSKRKAVSKVRDQEAVKKLFDVLASRYSSRDGGYARVLKYGFRKGDASPMAVIELVDRDINAKGNKDFIRLQEKQKTEVQES